MWKKISSKIILDHPRLKVVEDTVELPNGVKTDYVHFGIEDNAACIVAVNNEGKMLLIEEYSYPPNKMLLQFPGGTVPKDEDISAGAMRELQEETGFSAREFVELGSYYPHDRKAASKLYVFFAKNLEENPLPKDIEENISVHWYSGDEIENMIRSGKIMNVHTLAAWTLYKVSKKA